MPRRSVEPPLSDTGAPITSADDGLSLSVHWLRQTYSADCGLSEDDVLELVASVCGSSGGGYLETKDWGRMLYKRHHIFAPGVVVYTSPSVDTMPSVMIDVPGSACEAIGLDGLRTLAAVGRTARADLAYDGCPFSPADWAHFARTGGVRSRARTRRYVETLAGDGGNTFYLGSRQSDVLLRVYDRRESDSGVRVELQLSGSAAHSLELLWGQSDDEFRRLAVGLLRSVVELVDPTTGSGNISRAESLTSWSAWLEGLEAVKLWTKPRVIDCLERVEDWLTHQISAMLATYAAAGRSLPDLIERGRERMGGRHRRLVKMASLSRATGDAAPA